MKKSISILFISMMLFSGLQFPAYGLEPVETQTEDLAYVEGEALVLVADTGRQMRSMPFGGLNCETEPLMVLERDAAVMTRAAVPHAEQILLVKSDALSTEQLIDALETCPEVICVEPNYIYQVQGLSDDPRLSSQWHLHQDENLAEAAAGALQIESLWTDEKVTDDDTQVPVVAIVDTGVDYEHEDLKDNILTKADGSVYGYDFGANKGAGDADPMDENGHGTHVAGIIGAVFNNGIGVSGVAQDVKLMPLKASGDDDSFETADVLETYAYILEQKNNGVNIIAANNSWGGYVHSGIISKAIDYLGENGVISVNASGNYSVDHDLNLNMPEGNRREMYLLVNSSDREGNASYFSDYGLADTDLYAPGSRILSTIPEDDGTLYGYKSGTSMAAPTVSGAIALLYDYYDVGDLPADQQKGALEEIRARIAGGVTKTNEMKTLCASGGYLNLKKAITNPYPVLDRLEQDDREGTIYGHFFGTKGTLTMDGTPLKVTAWSDKAISFEIPEGTADGLHQFMVTDTTIGKSQWGSDQLWVREVPAADGQLSGTYFEELPAPDFDALQVQPPLDEMYAYSIASNGSKIYLTTTGLHTADGEQVPALLVYDVKTQKWSRIQADFLASDSEVQLVAGDGNLYIVETAMTHINIFRYDASKGTAVPVLKENKDTGLVGLATVLYHDGMIWFVGGVTWDGVNMADVSRSIFFFDVESGSMEEVETKLLGGRMAPMVQIFDNRVVVVGGLNEMGYWNPETEMIDLETGKTVLGAEFPNFYDGQQLETACGTFDGNMIVSGLWDTEEHKADTYLYDVEKDQWTIVDEKLLSTKVCLMGGTWSEDGFYVFGITIDGQGRKPVFRYLKADTKQSGSGTAANPSDGSGDGTGSKKNEITPNGGVNSGDENRPFFWLMVLAMAACGIAYGRRRA